MHVSLALAVVSLNGTENQIIDIQTDKCVFHHNAVSLLPIRVCFYYIIFLSRFQERNYLKNFLSRSKMFAVLHKKMSEMCTN